MAVWGPGELVSDVPESCLRISLIAEVASSGNSLEIGWHKDATGEAECWYPVPVPPDPPHILIIVYVNDQPTCFTHQSGYILSAGYHGFRAQNPDLNSTWDFYIDGDYYWTATTSFASATVLTNAERYGDGTSSYSEWDGLRFQSKVNGVVSWKPWVSSYEYFNNDPVYDPYFYGDTHVYVRL